MTKSEKYQKAVPVLAPDAPHPAEIVAELGAWIREQAAVARELCPPKNLRCFALVTNGATGPEMISLEFAAPDNSHHSILIHADGLHDLRGRAPHVIGLAAALRLLTLLADELRVPVRLQP